MTIPGTGMTHFCKELMGFFIAWGDFGLGGFCPRGILSRGILALGDFVLGGLCLGDFVLSPYLGISIGPKTVLMSARNKR